MHKTLVDALNNAVSGCNATHVAAEVGDDSIFVDPAHINAVCKTLKNCDIHNFNVLQVITGCDYEDRIEVSYILASFTKNLELILKTKLPKNGTDALAEVEIDSVCDLWKSADFQERECYDMLGVRFNNHPNMIRILCPYEGWEGFPLRKDYKVQESWDGLTINPADKVNSDDHFFFKRLKEEYGEDAKKVMHSWKE